MTLNAQFWEERYASQNTGWDLAGPSPHFVDLMASAPDFLKPAAMAVLGSGRGHDAAFFGKAGFEVTGFDYADQAVQEAQQRYGQWACFKQRDIFTLGGSDSPERQQFDYVLEHTCFCAILPQQRPDYVKIAANLLKPGGFLIGVFWEHKDPHGPPFSTPLLEVQTLFPPSFELISVTDRPPAGSRSGVERLIILRRTTEI